MILSSVAECLSPEHAIAYVEIKELKTFPDQRGFFREVIRFNDPFFLEPAPTGQRSFAQWSHSKMGRNTVKAWHYHHRQIDWWYAAIGVLHVVLYDNREESPTYRRKLELILGESDIDPRALAAVVKIPQGVLHGCKVISDSAHLFYVTSQTYNPEDEGRHPYNSPEVPHSWGIEEELIVAPNDLRELPPKHPRAAFAAL